MSRWTLEVRRGERDVMVRAEGEPIIFVRFPERTRDGEERARFLAELLRITLSDDEPGLLYDQHAAALQALAEAEQDAANVRAVAQHVRHEDEAEIAELRAQLAAARERLRYRRAAGVADDQLELVRAVLVTNERAYRAEGADGELATRDEMDSYTEARVEAVAAWIVGGRPLAPEGK